VRGEGSVCFQVSTSSVKFLSTGNRLIKNKWCVLWMCDFCSGSSEVGLATIGLRKVCDY